MIFFLNELPQGTLESNGIYFITNEEGNADLYVSSKTGEAVPVSTQETIKDFAADEIVELKNRANGVAGLGADNRVLESVMPTSFRTSTQIQASIQNALDSLVDAAPEQLNTLKEFSAALGNDADFASTVTSQLATKQAALPNASSVQKIGEGTFDGKPLVVVSTSEW